MNRAALFILIVATLSGPRRAAADVDPAAKQRADERFAAGIRFYDAAEQKHDASNLYNPGLPGVRAQAYAIYQDDRVLWNLALSEVDTKRYVAGGYRPSRSSMTRTSTCSISPRIQSFASSATISNARGKAQGT